MKKALVVHHISKRRLPILTFIKWMYKCDIYYISLNNQLLKVKDISCLEKENIRWIKRKYSNFSHYYRSQELSVEYAEIIYGSTRSSFINRFIKNDLNVNETIQPKMDVVWKYRINRDISSFAELYAAGEYLVNHEKYERVILLCFSSIASSLKKQFTDKQISVFILPLVDIQFILKRLSGLLVKWFGPYLRGKEKGDGEAVSTASGNVPENANFEKYSILFFPHQGIFFGDFFKKDHFYDDSKDSPLHKSNIFHLALGESKKEYMVESYKLYDDNQIPYGDLYDDYHYDKNALIRSLGRLVAKLNVLIIFDLCRYGLEYVLLSLYLYKEIKRDLLHLKRFTNAKLALAGYDWLFPRTLAFALSLLGIKICASQERVIIAFLPDNYLILDYYFVASDVVRENCMKTSVVDNFIPVGLVRVDSIYDYEKQNIYDEKYDRIKKNKKFILALDFHMPADDIEDTMRAAAKVRETREFYNSLIQLAHEFPSLYIAIKGRERDSYTSPYIADLVFRIKNIENMDIELDLAKYNPHYIGEKADLIVACHNSLCDEFLAAGRKVIIYESTDRLSSLFDYNKLPIIVGNYEDLKVNVEHFLRGHFMDEEKIKEIQTMLYSDCYHGHVRADIRRFLLKEVLKNQ